MPPAIEDALVSITRSVLWAQRASIMVALFNLVLSVMIIWRLYVNTDAITDNKATVTAAIADNKFSVTTAVRNNEVEVTKAIARNSERIAEILRLTKEQADGAEGQRER